MSSDPNMGHRGSKNGWCQGDSSLSKRFFARELLQSAKLFHSIGLLHHKLFSKTFRPIVADPILVEHLENLITKFDRYLPNINLEAQLWVRNPFLSKVDNLSEDAAGRAY